MNNKFSDAIIEITTKLMMVRDRADALKLSSELNEVASDIAKLETKTSSTIHTESTTAVMKLTKGEISKMPKELRSFFVHDGAIVHYRIVRGLYQVRYRKNGLSIEVASKSYEIMKKKFIDKLHEVATQSGGKKSPSVILFSVYAEHWYRNKEMTTKASTVKGYRQQLDTYLIPTFGKHSLTDITRQMLQDYLFGYVNQGKFRTAEKLKLTLKCIFDLVENDYGIKNPVKSIELPYYEPKKGSALTKEEEKILVDYCIKNRDNATSSALLILLYFGLRQSELPTLKITNGEEFKGENIDCELLSCETSKEKLGRNVVVRYIPYTNVAKRVLEYIDFEKAKTTKSRSIASTLSRLFKGQHHPHDLRYTFITRCKEAGVNQEVVMLWDGHSFDKDVKTSVVDRGYTDYSLRYFLEQAELVNYDL